MHATACQACTQCIPCMHWEGSSSGAVIRLPGVESLHGNLGWEIGVMLGKDCMHVVCTWDWLGSHVCLLF